MGRKPDGLPLTPIPRRNLPEWHGMRTLDNGEPLICLQEYLGNNSKFVFASQYAERGLKNASVLMYARVGTTEALLRAANSLPEGHKFILYDTYRSPETQQDLFEKEKITKGEANPKLTKEQVDKEIRLYVAEPSRDHRWPAPHSTGGAVDLSIVGPDGHPLNMGTAFDALDKNSHTAYYESSHNPLDWLRRIVRHKEMKEIIQNRRLLYNVMTAAGFTNYPGEWWHYDFNNRIHAALTNHPEATYGMPHYSNQTGETVYQKFLWNGLNK